ncbi:MAG: septal ring lytic transglycosylase RlpA family protein [Gammaproteobacteria bacterium]|nr:septal ring lytic transglycosylase RlpA family protein [Gammaproteobacteria bacterium]
MKRMNRLLCLYSSTVVLRRDVAAILVFAFCLTQLSGCGVVKQKTPGYDGPPKIDVDPSRVRDAVPRVEPLHPYGTKDYVLKGRHYKVLKSSKGYVKRGYASWYGSKFHGLETSTQERFNLYGMTAASPELPLPSYVQVTNLRNGKKVVVRVNDRGPFYGNRILDLSYAAAKKLGFADHGVAPVKIVAIDPKTWAKDNAVNKPQYASKDKELPQPNLNKSQIFLQLGAFAQLDNAKILSSKVNKIIDRPINIEHKSDLYRVKIGPLASSSQSDQLKSLLEQHGFEDITVIGG